MQLSIGQDVFILTNTTKTTEVRCADCAGKKEHTVILGNGEKYKASCKNCENGYEGSLGFIRVYEAVPNIVKGTVNGVSLGKDCKYRYQIEYKVNGATHMAFDIKEEAVSLTEEGLLQEINKVIEREAANKDAAAKRKTTKDDGTPFSVAYHRQLMNRSLRETNKWAERFNLKAVLVPHKNEQPNDR